MSVTSHGIDLPEGYSIPLPFWRQTPRDRLFASAPCMSLLWICGNTMSSLFPSNRPVRVFPLDQKPRWLQSAGERETERGEASRIKLEWNQMTWNIPGLKSHCAAKTQTQIYICSVKLIKLEIVRKHIKNRAIKSMFSFKPYLLSSCYCCFFFHKEASCWCNFSVIVCLCTLVAMSARCV